MSTVISMETVALGERLEPFLIALALALCVAALSRMVSWFRNIPYTVLLVVVGLGLAVADVRLVNLSPELSLSIFLPLLLFEAGWNLHWREVKTFWIPIGLYAILGVVIAVVGIAFSLNWLVGLSLPTALLLGASLCATDPVSVTALLRELGANPRLTTILEGESLFNDGIAVVIFGFLLAFAQGDAELTPQAVLVKFSVVVGVGSAIGSLAGFGISYLTQRFDLPKVEQSLTLVAAYGSYLVSEEFGGSGVIAVVITGMILGNFGSRIGMNPRTRLMVTDFWDFLSFFVNSIVFVLIGDQIYWGELQQNLGVIGATILATLLTRLIGVFGLGWISNRLSPISLPRNEQIVLWWGGLRGSVSIALALSLPLLFPGRDEVLATVFGVVLFTLLVQGISLKPLLQKLDLLGDFPLQEQYREVIARRFALQRVLDYLPSIRSRPGIDPEFFSYQESLITGELEKLEEEIEKLVSNFPSLKPLIAEQMRQELLSIEADTYAELIMSGRLNRELAPLLLVEKE